METPAPDFQLKQASGQPVTLDKLRGNIVVLTFLYSQCQDICPVIAAKLNKVYTGLGADTENVRLVAISVAPEVDTPESVRAFSEKFGMQDKWLYLTGSRTELAPVWSNYYLYVGSLAPDVGAIEHQSRLLLIDRAGQERVNFSADFGVEDVVHDIEMLVHD